jgi:hypothetical protein
MGMDDCDDNGNCINLQGAYLCRCRDGYFGTGYTCKPFDEEPTVMTIVSDEPTVENPVSDEPTVCVETAPQEDMPHTHSRHTHSRHTHSRHRSHHTHSRHRSHHTHSRHRSHHTHSHYSHTRTNTPTAQQAPCGNSNPINDEEDTTTRRTRTRTTPRSNTRPRDVQQDEASGTDSASHTQRPSNRGSGSDTPRGRSRGAMTTDGRQTSTTAIRVPAGVSIDQKSILFPNHSLFSLPLFLHFYPPLPLPLSSVQDSPITEESGKTYCTPSSDSSSTGTSQEAQSDLGTEQATREPEEDTGELSLKEQLKKPQLAGNRKSEAEVAAKFSRLHVSPPTHPLLQENLLTLS